MGCKLVEKVLKIGFKFQKDAFFSPFYLGTCYKDFELEFGKTKYYGWG